MPVLGVSQARWLPLLLTLAVQHGCDAFNPALPWDPEEHATVAREIDAAVSAATSDSATPAEAEQRAEAQICSILAQNNARLADSPNSFDESGEISLGGGIEYSFTKSFCTDMQAAMWPPPSCKELRQAVQKAGQMWADRHPRIFFKEVRMLSKSEVVLAAGRMDGAKKDTIAQVGPTESGGRFRLTFNTRHCFTPKLLMDSLGLASDYDRLDALEAMPVPPVCKRRDKLSWQPFEMTLAHELGHVLGLDHPGDSGYFLDSNTKHGVNDFISINSENLCAGLQVFKQETRCTADEVIRDYKQCNAMPACNWNKNNNGYCDSVFSRTMMSAHANRDHLYMLKPTCNDMAGLYFLYPHKTLGMSDVCSAGKSRVPLMSMPMKKLQHMAAAHGVPIEDGGAPLTKSGLARAIVNATVGHIMSMGSSPEIKQSEIARDRKGIGARARQKMSRLATALKNGFRYLIGKRDANNDGIPDREQADADNDGILDDIEDEVRNGIAAANADIRDEFELSQADDDGDGLSNEVEGWLDTLNELLDDDNGFGDDLPHKDGDREL